MASTPDIPAGRNLSARHTLVAIAWVLAILVYSHPYYGIRHDAVLYLGQGLLTLSPENFQNDLFFVFGSQASFTILPKILGLLLGQFGAAETFKVLTFLSLCGFAGASWFVLRKLFERPLAYWSLIAVLTLPSLYGGYSVISYAEGFFTGRSLAEPLTLVAIGLYLVGKPVVALVAIAVAALVHPLQALPALLLAWVDLVRHDKRWLVLACVPVGVALGGALGVAPFHPLVKVFDREWLEMTREANPMTMLSLWQTRDWMSLATDAFLVGLLIWYSKLPAVRRLGIAALVATGLALSLSYLGADLLNLVHITGIQIWRTHWLLHWVAMASVPVLILHVANGSDPCRVRTLTLILIVVSAAPTPTLLSNGLVNCALIPLYLAWPALKTRSSLGIQRVAFFALCVVIVILLVKLGIHAHDQYLKFGGLRESVRPEFIILTHPLTVAGLAIAYICLQRLPRHPRLIQLIKPVELVVVFLFCLVAFTNWDRRSIWTAEIEAAQSNPRLFGVEIENGAQVFWENELVAPWLILGRPSYFNGMQAAGALFNRETAIEGRRRQNVQKLLEFQTTICKIFNELNVSGDRCNVDAEVAAKMCIESDDLLKYLVLESNIDAPHEGVWRSVGGIKNIRPIEYRLYSCEKLKQRP